MGIEVLKVTGQIVRDSKGQKANLLKYAYKFNSLLSFAEDAQVQFKTGCSRASHYVETSQILRVELLMQKGAHLLIGTEAQFQITD